MVSFIYDHNQRISYTNHQNMTLLCKKYKKLIYENMFFNFRFRLLHNSVLHPNPNPLLLLLLLLLLFVFLFPASVSRPPECDVTSGILGSTSTRSGPKVSPPMTSLSYPPPPPPLRPLPPPNAVLVFGILPLGLFLQPNHQYETGLGKLGSASSTCCFR
jgi:hypothetical protein